MNNDTSFDIIQESNPVQTVAQPKEDNEMLRATDRITAWPEDFGRGWKSKSGGRQTGRSGYPLTDSGRIVNGLVLP